MDLASLQDRLSGAARARIACVGDLMLDRYVYGEVGRISPEAPIPVLLRQDEAVMLGAVGNVARNAAALGAEVAIAGVVGDDAAGHETARLIEAESRLVGHLSLETGRRTTVKTRFVAAGQQLLRPTTSARPRSTPAAKLGWPTRWPRPWKGRGRSWCPTTPRAWSRPRCCRPVAKPRPPPAPR
jgi:D-beta-D-heptose 7-phosphate kinase/D-beta-D-heptose 1-phosphate adenosyltransferase